MTRTQITIHGFIVGRAWSGYEAYSPLSYNLTREQKRNVARRSLRDHVLSATNSGDFQSCLIANGQMSITMTKTRNNRVYEFTKWFALEDFPSITDCVLTGDWSAPDYDYDESENA